MIEKTIDVTTDDGLMPTFACQPDRGKHRPVFIMMDAPGIREELRDAARRLASVGFVVFLPNLYYRSGRDTLFGPDVIDKTSDEFKRMQSIRKAMTIPPVMNDVAALLDIASSWDGCRAGPAGIHGYSMGGPFALAAAARFADQFAAAASIFGSWLVSDDIESPHRSLDAISAELYIGCAEHDDLAPPEMVEKLQGLFEKSGNPGELEIYEGARHGFAFAERPVYDKPSAERHWERLIALYLRRLSN